MRTGRIDPVMGIQMLKICDMTYNNPELSDVPDFKVEQIKVIEDKKTDTQGKVWIQTFHDESCLVFSFRGTEQKIQDWATDLSARQMVIPYDNPNTASRVHEGFIKAYKSVRQQVHDSVKWYAEQIPVLNYKKTVRITGHSLGAALATLCAIDLQYNFGEGKIFETLQAYPFASPRVGNRAFVDSFNKRVTACWRVVNRADLVPDLPLTSMGYRHVDTKVPLGIWNPFEGIISIFNQKGRFMAQLVNHGVGIYYDRLKNYK